MMCNTSTISHPEVSEISDFLLWLKFAFLIRLFKMELDVRVMSMIM